MRRLKGSRPTPSRAHRTTTDRSKAPRHDAATGIEAAAAERPYAKGEFDEYESSLRAVVDATGVLAAARAADAEARYGVDATAERFVRLAHHRGEIVAAIAEVEALRGRANTARVVADAPAAGLIALAESVDAARWARQLAESARSECTEVSARLQERHASAEAHAASLRAAVDALQHELASHGSADEAALRAALRAYDDATSAPVDKLALALAERWAALQCQRVELDAAEPAPPTAEQLAAAAAHLQATEATLVTATTRANACAISPEVREAIEAAHGAVLATRKRWGGMARQRQRQAEEELEHLLAAHGLSSWLEYLTAGLSVDARKKSIIGDAERELVRAREQLAALEAAAIPSLERAALLEAIECARRDIIGVLGFWPDGDVDRHLRAQPLVDPKSSAKLYKAAARAGVAVGERPVAAAVRAWLEERDIARRARSEIEADLALASGRLDALLTTELMPSLDDVARWVADAAELADASAERWGRLEALLSAVLELPASHEAEDRTAAVLDARHQALSWLLATVEHDTEAAHRRALSRAEEAGTARVGAEAALDGAWQSLRARADEPVPDLPAAVARLGRLLRDSAAMDRVFVDAATACDGSRLVLAED